MLSGRFLNGFAMAGYLPAIQVKSKKKVDFEKTHSNLLNLGLCG